jgi:hypothetical protein
MHANPKLLFHHDIHWPNIIWDTSLCIKWFLIDWDDASTTMTQPAVHLDQNSHQPMVFKNDHGTEVDIWGAGKLIVDAVAFLSITSPVMLQKNINVKCKIVKLTSIQPYIISSK